MNKRRVLVIGSQCQQLPTLSFLPAAATDLYGIFTAAEVGGCVSALPDREGLLIDPTVTETQEAIDTAITQALRDEATLLLAFIGHGEYVDRDFYFLPLNAQVPPRAHTSIAIAQYVKECLREQERLDGLVILLDTCYAGVATAQAATQWVNELKGRKRFEVFTAVGDRPAADGCFSRNLATFLRTGLDSVPSQYLRCEHLLQPLKAGCPHQEPELLASNADEGLHLAKNVGAFTRKAFWLATNAAAEIERLTAWFQPTPALAGVVAASQQHRCVAVIGLAGTGKSAIAAGLARPEVSKESVPTGFAHAVVFLSERTTAYELALQLGTQLQVSLPQFREAQEYFQAHTTAEELATLNALQRDVLGPLRWLPETQKIRLVIDGLDHLMTGTQPIMAMLEQLATDPALAMMHLVVTCRPDTRLPSTATQFLLGTVHDYEIRAYLIQRHVMDASVQEAILRRARGNWLITQLLADLAATNPALDPHQLPPTLVSLYTKRLQDAGAVEDQRWRQDFRPIVSVLAAAGVGPVLPLPLLCAASQRLGGPSRPARVRDVLVDLRGVVVRADPGTEEERVGLFHLTFAEYLLDPVSEFGTDPQEAHAALMDALKELAPMANHDARHPLHQYAAAREADHLWEIGAYDRIVDSLEKRASVIPAENLARWQAWFPRFQTKLGQNHRSTLRIRCHIANWTGETGDASTALQLLTALLPDQVRVLGPDDRDSLVTRNNIASWTGETGDASTALQLFTALLPDQVRVLGPDDRDSLVTRSNLASWTGETGDATTALQLFTALLPDQVRVLGPDDRDSLVTRSNLASWTGETGDATTALQLFTALLPDQVCVLGPDHSDTLRTRGHIANWTGETGDASTALQLFTALLPDQVRALGPDHYDTLLTRSNIAGWTRETGDATTALQLLTALLPDQVRALGPDNRETLATRNNFANWTGETGDATTALQLLTALLPDQVRALGPDHSDTLKTQSDLERYTAAVDADTTPPART